jgi:hypothetical protein
MMQALNPASASARCSPTPPPPRPASFSAIPSTSASPTSPSTPPASPPTKPSPPSSPASHSHIGSYVVVSFCRHPDRVPHPRGEAAGWGPLRRTMLAGVERGVSFAVANDRLCLFLPSSSVEFGAFFRQTQSKDPCMLFCPCRCLFCPPYPA